MLLSNRPSVSTLELESCVTIFTHKYHALSCQQCLADHTCQNEGLQLYCNGQQCAKAHTLQFSYAASRAYLEHGWVKSNRVIQLCTNMKPIPDAFLGGEMAESHCLPKLGPGDLTQVDLFALYCNGWLDKEFVHLLTMLPLSAMSPL